MVLTRYLSRRRGFRPRFADGENAYVCTHARFSQQGIIPSVALMVPRSPMASKNLCQVEEDTDTLVSGTVNVLSAVCVTFTHESGKKQKWSFLASMKKKTPALHGPCALMEGAMCKKYATDHSHWCRASALHEEVLLGLRRRLDSDYLVVAPVLDSKLRKYCGRLVGKVVLQDTRADVSSTGNPRASP